MSNAPIINKQLKQWFKEIDKQLEKGKGLSMYDVQGKDVDAVLNYFNDTMCDEYRQIKLSNLSHELKNEYNQKTPLVIHQDIDYKDFLTAVDDVVNQFIYPAWHNKLTVFFISELNKEVYIVDEIDSRLVHNDYTKIINLLTLEQMNKLLEMMNLSVSISEGRQITKDKNLSSNEVQKQLNIKATQTNNLEALNPEQTRAVNHINGPIRVLAPAGSGKTKTLVNRIVNLVNNGIDQKDILALAFNKKARNEMDERLKSNFALMNVNVSTFHAFGNNIINKTLGWKFNSSAEIIGTRQLLTEAVTKHKEIGYKRNEDVLDKYLELLSRSKNELLPEEKMKVHLENEEINFQPIFEDYILNMVRHSFYNFDDMVYLAVRKLLSDPDIRDEVQRKYKYILVDEFQDLNKAQLLLLQILILPENNVFVCGDDDQMIYSFRGAEINNILDFNSRYTITKDQILKINYRSASNIVNQSKWLIDHNKNRVEKDITPFKETKGKIDLFIGESLKDQAEKVVEWILKHKTQAVKWSDFAIVYRYNQYRDLLFMILTKHNIPVANQGVTILNSNVGRLIMAYLTVLFDQANSTQRHYQEILQKPNKYLTNNFIKTVRSWEDFVDTRRGRNYLKTHSFDNYVDFVDKMKNFDLTNKKPVHAINLIIETFDLKQHFKTTDKKSEEKELATDIEVLEIIASFSSIFDTVSEFYNYVLNLKDSTHENGLNKASSDVVLLTTIHRTKGNEYQNVAYYNLNAESTHEISQKEYEEERRITYVAMTRAKERLIVTTKKGDVSPFVKEIFLNPKYANIKERSLKEKLRNLKIEDGNLNATHDKEKTPVDNQLNLLEDEVKYRRQILQSMMSKQ